MIAAFLRRSWHTYVGNATAVRDYRSQLRGNKAIWIWGGYLALLILLCAIAYSGFVREQEQSISQLQSQLNNFYRVVIMMLGSVIVLAAPAMTASTITIERQRKSLDLIFSAPVPPRYLLVGKLIAGFRYLLMLLVLALPVTAVCVVMGGATWGDVVGAFLLLMASGLVLMSIGLLISSLSPTTISAIAGTYMATIAYAGVTSLFSAMLAATAFGGPMMGMSATNEATWTVALSPFTASMAAPTFTRIGTTEVPNWVFALVFSLVLSKLLLAGAGSALSPYGSSETKILRALGWLFAFLLTFLSAVPLGAFAMTTLRSATAATSTGPSPDYIVGLLVGVCTAAVFFVIPHIVCYAKEADLKYRNDGVFSLRKVLVGTPAGAWPYLFGLSASASLGAALGFRYSSGQWPSWEFLSLALWSIGYLTLWWGLGRYFSSFKLGLKGARSAVIAVMILLIAVPVPIFVMYMAGQMYGTDATSIWRLHLLYPLSVEGAQVAWGYGLACGIAGVLFAFLGEANVKRDQSR